MGSDRGRRALALGVLAGLACAAVPATSWAAPASVDVHVEAADVAEVAEGVTNAQNPHVPVGARWTEAYFPSPSVTGGDPVELHADVLRPAHLDPDAATPVILSIGPYFSHSGQATDEHRAYTGPSERFRPFIEGADLMAAGYTFVYVDLRGFGGSTGCTDWLGAGEQADIVSAVEWAASQPWSSGAVGLYGKSYDATTGLAGIGLEPHGLGAVVSQEPVWAPFDYLVSNGVPRPNQVQTPESFLDIAALPGISQDYTEAGYDIPADTARYRENAAYELSHPECAADLFAATSVSDPADPVWTSRDLPTLAAGSTVPLFFTQGLLEQNTKPEDMERFLASHAGEQRAWIGPWEHVRGDEKDAQGRFQMGRDSWYSEVRAFYDQHLRGAAPTEPARFFVQDSLGAWRVQEQWPVVSRRLEVALSAGSYLDDGRGDPDDDDGGPVLASEAVDGADPFDDGGPDDAQPADTLDPSAPATLSYPVTAPVRLTGEPAVTLTTRGAGNTWVTLWDVAPDRSAVIVNEQVSVLDAAGSTRIRLKSMDWTLETGHQLLVSVSSIDHGFWVPSPSGARVEVIAGSLELPLQRTDADVATAGVRAPYLDTHRETYATRLSFEVTPTFAVSLEDEAPVTPDAGAPLPSQLALSGGGADPLVAVAALALLGAGVALRRRGRLQRR